MKASRIRLALFSRRPTAAGSSARRRRKSPPPPPRDPETLGLLRERRHAWLLGLFLFGVTVLLGRVLYLQVMHKDFLQSQGEARLVRQLPLPAHRGMIMDRHGEPLAISTPVDSLWIHPRQFLEGRDRWPVLANLLDLPLAELEKRVADRQNKEFVYLKRHLSPELAARVESLALPGAFLQREYHRYYPAGESTAHVLGFTDIDDRGQEGLELAFDAGLRGESGSRRVIQDKRGRIIATAGELVMPRPGRDLRLSIDRRLHHVAHRALGRAVDRHRARAGSLVILEVKRGEILALVNQPGYNPNNREALDSDRYRNRAVTDVFEPGSTIKPFTIAAALESGRYTPGTFVNTHPGRLRLGKYTVRDARDYGSITLATVLRKSSNVGAGKIGLSLPAEQLWRVLSGSGLGELPGSGFPGEVSGRLAHYSTWRETRQASLSFGYGLSVSLLQLAHAYTVLAGDGRLRPLRWTPLPEDGPRPTGVPVIAESTARAVRGMLVGVVTEDGTAPEARIPGYQVAGKTGTVHKAEKGGYASKRYVAVFAGMAPAEHPRLVAAVMLDEPRGDYYGGEVAAPVFAEVMAEALRLMNIPPD